MMTLASPVAWICVLALLVMAWPASQRWRHERRRPLSAYLLLVSIFALVGAAVFVALAAFARLSGFAASAGTPAAALVTLALVLIPAVLLGRAVIRRPPRPRMPR
jgi:hypothetical protein